MVDVQAPAPSFPTPDDNVTTSLRRLQTASRRFGLSLNCKGNKHFPGGGVRSAGLDYCRYIIHLSCEGCMAQLHASRSPPSSIRSCILYAIFTSVLLLNRALERKANMLCMTERAAMVNINNRIKQRRAWLLLGWVTAERSCPCKQSACPAIGGGMEITYNPLVPSVMDNKPSIGWIKKGRVKADTVNRTSCAKSADRETVQ
ncbi:hypothetical protein J6590_047547 [Homalodisca vitripennis]|nr:hypothetical protein J6590_047547 [Homalodisca vitripennis]